LFSYLYLDHVSLGSKEQCKTDNKEALLSEHIMKI